MCGNDNLPLAVPDAAADEPGVGEDGRQVAGFVERGIRHHPEGLVLAGDPWPFREGVIRAQELGGVEITGS